MRSYQFYIKPAAGERVSAQVPLPPEGASLVSGTVTDGAGAPVPEALVLLLNHSTGALLESTVSDDHGRFFFGPLAGDQVYAVRVQKSGAAGRELELKIPPQAPSFQAAAAGDADL